MSRIFLKEYIKLVAVKNFRNHDRMIDYYIDQPGKEQIYAFSRVYTNRTYEMCKSGMRVNALAVTRSRDHGVMGLIDHLNVMLPYLSEYYELPRR